MKTRLAERRSSDLGASLHSTGAWRATWCINGVGVIITHDIITGQTDARANALVHPDKTNSY